jgi:CRP/FNR family transcriptional regulator, cyclic AMP receptor protein
VRARLPAPLRRRNQRALARRRISCKTLQSHRPNRQEAVLSQLARVSGFERLDTKELEQLEALTERKHYPANTAVFFQDDPADALFILLSGSAKMFQTSEDGKDRILRILQPGNAFGDLAMIEGKDRFVTVQTLEDSEVLRLPRKRFVEFANTHTWVLWTLLSAFAERIRRMNEDVLDLSFRDVPYRLLHALADLVQRHGHSGPDGWTITMQLSASDLASMIGSNTDTVGRLLDRYENDGLIKRVGPHWVVPDPTAITRTLEYTAQQGV